jgi:predicted NBD/HSP70 family sugar kinase
MRIGIDLGGTKIEIVALNEQGDVLWQERAMTPQGNYQGTLETINKLIDTTEQQLGEQGSVGIGTPGAISPESGKLRNSNSTCLNDMPFKEDLEALLNRPVRMENDANCFALSEAVDGAGKDATVVFGVIVGTGTGGGIVINKKVLTGQNAIAGEWGHNPLPWMTKAEHPGNHCYCGKNGCIETFLSGPGMSKYYEGMTGEYLTAEQIAQQAQQGNEAREATLRLYEDRMARALASVVNMIDPDVIVLGGGLSKLERLYTNVPEQWGQYIFSDVINTQLLPPKYGDSSGVRGAAWLWNK